MSSRCKFKRFFSSFFTKVSCRCGCPEYRKRQAKRIVLQRDALKFTNVHFCANVYKHLSNRGDAIYLQKPWEIHTFFGGRRKIWFLNQTLKNFQKKNRLLNHFLNNDDFVAEWKNNRNRRAKCNAIKHHVLSVEQKSRIYQTCHKRRDKKQLK